MGKGPVSMGNKRNLDRKKACVNRKQKELTVYRWEKDVCHPISMENKRNLDGKKNLSMVNNFDGTSVNGKQMNSDGKIQCQWLSVDW